MANPAKLREETLAAMDAADMAIAVIMATLDCPYKDREEAAAGLLKALEIK